MSRCGYCGRKPPVNSVSAGLAFLAIAVLATWEITAGFLAYASHFWPWLLGAVAGLPAILAALMSVLSFRPVLSPRAYVLARGTAPAVPQSGPLSRPLSPGAVVPGRVLPAPLAGSEPARTALPALPPGPGTFAPSGEWR